ncbi:MAG: GAF domain-containing sensor histidine kinase [Anaerolineaceae bacterium]|nr:GAF domain-containing sensor histidine kinase [Anaerolineaceae bacterium]
MEQVKPAAKPGTAISPEHLARLLQISQRLSSTLRLDELLSLVMDVATELTHTETASILLVNRSTGQLHFAASTRGEVLQDIVVPLDNSIAGWVVRHGRSLILDDVQTDERFYANVDEDLEFVTRSMLAVPLVTSQGVIGALEVINKQDNAHYTGQDVALMEALASQSAVAIMNAHLFSQSDLIAEIMHELKTPLMAISAASELLSRPEIPQEKHADLVSMIKKESNRLSKMTKDFLDFARLESGRMRLAREAVPVRQIIEDVVNISQAQAAARGIEIVMELAPDLPAASGKTAVIGDADRLKQVLLNLVSNAVKYNVVNGRITLSASCQANVVQISVADTGPGIEPEDIGHLFERFYRIPGSESAEGSGLGLSVAQKIVEEHHGHIEVDSIVGEGTTFTIYLPVTAVA